MIQYVTQHEAEFVQEAADSSLRERDAEFSRKRDTLTKAESRIVELDNIFKHLYEDNVTGKLSDDRFIKMSRDYELEQENLKAIAAALRAVKIFVCGACPFVEAFIKNSFFFKNFISFYFHGLLGRAIIHL